nr:fer-1-like protein 5 [Anolis sagrei ordinatus]
MGTIELPKTAMKLAMNKKQEFQVRVRILECRQLQENNIKPVVKVYIGDHVFRTRIKAGNNPFYNEIFVKNFKDMPLRLFDQFITIQVLNSRAIRADSLIGVFKIEMGLVYNSPGHALLSRWLTLYDPNNLNAGLRGYVKVNLCVLGPGDRVPDTDFVAEKGDTEAMLLRPAAMPSGRLVTLQLYVFQAQDMPQMNEDLVNYGRAEDPTGTSVDSCLEVNFAGKVLSTSIVFGDANPIWNQRMSFPMLMPSICDLIKLSAIDGDRSGDGQILGFAFLSLSQISCSGTEIENKKDFSGFQPCFGPSFLTLYGNPKEFVAEGDALENFSVGAEEGIAYRGRVLVELSIKTEKLVVPKIENIPEESVKRIERFLPQVRYGLCVVFYSATMLADIKEQIQFEVSIGNYGNKFDGTCKPFASTTQYCHAVFDGNRYYYLPWYDTKPMVAITSFWEDVGHRMACMNAMQFIHTRLKKNTDALKAIRVPNDSLVEVAWKRLQKELVEDCKRPLPSTGGKAPATFLDLQLRKLRIRLLHQVSKAADKTSWKNPLKKLISKAETWLSRIAVAATETQICIPDVLIWMLCDDNRVAYARVKSHSILFSKASAQARGRLCGKTQTVFMQGPQTKEKPNPVPAVLRVRMWLGQMTDSAEFMKCCESPILVYAETYENQKKTHGIWGTRDLLPHPNFSDVTGQISLPRDKFQPPLGWKWDGEWAVEPQRRLLLDKETNLSEVLVEVYENQSREPRQPWSPASIPFSNASGIPLPPKEDIECPKGWSFVEEWKVELNRAVDDAGWEYGVGIPPAEFPRTWNMTEKTYHTHRRRRWLRKRCRDLNKETQENKMMAFLRLHSDTKVKPETWEYAPLVGWRFHLQQLPGDVFRRRCWRRKLVPVAPSHGAPIFHLEGSLGVEVEEEGKKRKGEAEKKDEKKEGKEVEKQPSQSLLKMNTPLLYCIFKSPVYFQLRCYIYQARDLVGASTKSSADPVAHISFVHTSQCTKTVHGTLHPLWDQTLIFDNILIYGDPRATEEDPPVVAVEIVDADPTGRSEHFIGRCLSIPRVYLDLSLRRMPRLQKLRITKEQTEAGELLAAFELLLDKKDGSLGKHPPPAWKDGLYTIPKEIRPILRLMAVEILAWGLRDMKNYNLLVINNPSLIVECGMESLQTPIIKNFQENPNFPINIYLMKVYLPVDEDYAPPIELKVIDHREFGFKPVVGHVSVQPLRQYYCDPWAEKKVHNLPLRGINYLITSLLGLKGGFSQDFLIGLELGLKFFFKPWLWKKRKEERYIEDEEEEEVDWWSKFYVTTGDLAKSGNYLKWGFDTVKIYNCELEEVPEFQGFQDFCQTFILYRETVTVEDPVIGGEFKGLFRIYPISEDPNIPPPPRQFQELPQNVCQMCLVRVYIIRALNLQPKDRNGLCDPYVWIKIGKKNVGERNDYIPNTLEPVFGRMYELMCCIPLEKDLKVCLFDFDVFPPDDAIGETTIDLENRLYSRFGANCGLPQTFCVAGPTQWRDQLLPTELLANYTRTKDLPPAEITEDGSEAIFLGRTYQLADFETQPPLHDYLGPAKERLALYLLRTCGLVPEHIETRTLYSAAHPGIDQGKVQMWVDIFPESLGEPGPPFDIIPRQPNKYELRVIIWNTKDVDLEDTNIFGDRMSDIYVKGWLDGLEEDMQKTDVHYRSLSGEGNFNWRFVFHMDYLPMEQVLVLSKKQHFWSLDETMEKVPPKLIIQIWDNDKFSVDDFLGILELNLTNMPRPAKRPRDCTIKMLMEDAAPSSKPFLKRKKQQHISIFTQRNTRGWWPCIIIEKDKPRVSGKVEMTLELLTEFEAEERPAGRGREEPNMNPVLTPPERPETSFLWFTAPLKSVHFLIWQKSKWKLLIFFCCILVFFLFASFIYSAPGYLAMKLIQPMSGTSKVEVKLAPNYLPPSAAPQVPPAPIETTTAQQPPQAPPETTSPKPAHRKQPGTRRKQPPASKKPPRASKKPPPAFRKQPPASKKPRPTSKKPRPTSKKSPSVSKKPPQAPKKPLTPKRKRPTSKKSHQSPPKAKPLPSP